MYEKEYTVYETTQQIVRETVPAIKTIHFGEGSCMNFQVVLDKGDRSYRGMTLLDFEKMCTFCLHQVQDMLGEDNSEEKVAVMDALIAVLEQNLYDDYFAGTDEELFQEDMERLN